MFLTWWEPENPNRFLYHPTLAVDANFHLKHLDKSSDKRDPGLHTGLAYFVEQDAYI